MSSNLMLLLFLFNIMLCGVHIMQQSKCPNIIYSLSQFVHSSSLLHYNQAI